MTQDLFLHRADPATLPELMDGPCTAEEFRACLRDLAQVNVVTLAHWPTMTWLEQFAGSKETLHIVDVGSGGGDMLRRIARWGRQRKLNLKLTGIDLNPYAEPAARAFSQRYPQIRFLTGNAFELVEPIDIVLSSLVTHHMRDEEIIGFIRWMQSRARRGWFINDLARSERAAKLFAVLARTARWHPFVRHDGPVSIRRGFRKGDWVRLLAEAAHPPGFPDADIEIKSEFPSRLTVACVKRPAA